MLWYWFFFVKNGLKYNIVINDKKQLKVEVIHLRLPISWRSFAEKNKNCDLFYLTALSPDWEVPTTANYKFTLCCPRISLWDDLSVLYRLGSQDVSKQDVLPRWKILILWVFVYSIRFQVSLFWRRTSRRILEDPLNNEDHWPEVLFQCCSNTIFGSCG